MKIIFLFTVSLNALDFVGIDNDETLTILSRSNRGVGRGRKFGDFYNKLKSKTSENIYYFYTSTETLLRPF